MASKGESKRAALARSNARSRVPAKVDFDELNDIRFSDVVMDSELLDQYPDMRKMTKRQQVVLAAAAMGLGHRAIAAAMGITHEAVGKMLRVIDPDSRVRVSREGKRAFITRMVESRMSESLLAITPEKLNDSTAKELTTIAKNLAGISQTMNQSKHRSVSSGRLTHLMSEIEGERISKADVTVIEEADLEVVE